MKKIFPKLIITLATFVVLFSFFFGRAPGRDVPTATVISPTSGTVIHIEETSNGEVEFYKNDIRETLTLAGMPDDLNYIVVKLDAMDVHVQRSPLQGAVTFMEHFPGRHDNALWGGDLTKLANENEKAVTVFENETTKVGVIQVTGAMARRIRNSVSTGENIAAGEYYGRILLGSQVVIVLPASLTIDVAVGDELIDGESVVSR